MVKNVLGILFVLLIMAGTVSAAPVSLKSYPNPFVSELTITFSLEKDEELKLGVYNLLGQQIREISKGKHIAGDFRFTWNGKDGSGKSVPTGMYYIIFVQGEEKQVLKILKSR